MKTVFRLFSFSLLLILLSATSVFAQEICNSTVFDGAGVLGSNLASVRASASKLSAAGADPHIVTYSGLTGATIDQTVANTVKSCPAWQAPNGGPKSTIVIIAVAPTQRKMGIYAGKSYEAAFNSANMTRYRTEFMGPHFKAGEWAAGLSTTADQMSARLTAFTSEANQPVQNTVINQASAPTSLTGLWIFLLILAGLAGVGLLFLILSRLKAAKEAIKTAQAAAVAYRNEAADLVNSLSAALGAAKATDPGVKSAQSLYDTYSAAYNRLAQTLSGDPSDDTLSKEAYLTLANQYRNIVAQLQLAQNYLNTPTLDPDTFTPIDEEDPTKGYTIPPQTTGKGKSAVTTEEQTVTVAPATDNSFVMGMAVGAIMGHDVSPSRDDDESPSRSDESESGSGFSSGSGSSSSDDDSGSSSSDFSSSSGSSDFGSSSSDESSSSSSSDDSSSSSDSFSSDSGSSSFDSGSSSSDFSGGSGGSDF